MTEYMAALSRFKLLGTNSSNFYELCNGDKKFNIYESIWSSSLT